MPLFMDVHSLDAPVDLDDVAKAHAADLQAQGPHGVQYIRDWADEGRRVPEIVCLADASAASAECGHREAHGLVADEIYQVVEGA